MFRNNADTKIIDGSWLRLLGLFVLHTGHDKCRCDMPTNYKPTRELTLIIVHVNWAENSD